MPTVSSGSSLGASISTGEIDNLAVTAAKLAAGAVTAAKVGPGLVGFEFLRALRFAAEGADLATYTVWQALNLASDFPAVTSSVNSLVAGDVASTPTATADKITRRIVTSTTNGDRASYNYFALPATITEIIVLGMLRQEIEAGTGSWAGVGVTSDSTPVIGASTFNINNSAQLVLTVSATAQDFQIRTTGSNTTTTQANDGSSLAVATWYPFVWHWKTAATAGQRVWRNAEPGGFTAAGMTTTATGPANAVNFFLGGYANQTNSASNTADNSIGAPIIILYK